MVNRGLTTGRSPRFSPITRPRSLHPVHCHNIKYLPLFPLSPSRCMDLTDELTFGRVSKFAFTTTPTRRHATSSARGAISRDTAFPRSCGANDNVDVGTRYNRDRETRFNCSPLPDWRTFVAGTKDATPVISPV